MTFLTTPLNGIHIDEEYEKKAVKVLTNPWEIKENLIVRIL